MKETDLPMWIMGTILGLTIGGLALMDFIKMMFDQIEPEDLIDKDLIELPEEQMEQKMAVEGQEEEAPSDEEKAA
ncbi:hypothetical protein OAK75_06130 [Bacteriovoracales bacterium]|nr:hypothetical protein [Bacteriovoracales bacterium]